MQTNQSQKNIPNGWERKRLSEIGRALIGLTYSPNDVVETGGILVFRSSNIKLGKIDYSDQVRVKASISEKNFVKEGDILICARNGSRDLIGKNAYISKCDEGNVFGAFMTIFRAKNSRYIYQLFQSSLYKKEIEMDLGPTINQVTTGNLSRFKFNFPHPPEQNRIVLVLETWDKAIENLNKKIEIKKQIKKGLMQDLLTGKKRLSGFNDKWEFINLGETCKEIKTGKLDANAMIENGKYRFYTCAKDYYFIDDYAFDTEALLVSGNGANVGYVHYYKGKFNAYQRTYVLFGFTQNIIFIKYILDLFLKTRIKEEVREGNTPYITMDTLTDMEIKIPSIKEQTVIVEILTTSDKEITELERKLEIIKDQKKYLLNNLITGVIRTPENLLEKVK